MIALIACGASKLAHPAKARDLYTGALFQKSVRYAELRFYFATQRDRFAHRNSHSLVVSAKHGIVPMDAELAPYDVSLESLTSEQKHAWFRKLVRDMHDRTTRCRHVLVLAGRAYDEAVTAALDFGGPHSVPYIERPLAGMMIGERLQFLTREIARLEADLPRLSDSHARSKG